MKLKTKQFKNSFKTVLFKFCFSFISLCGQFYMCYNVQKVANRIIKHIRYIILISYCIPNLILAIPTPVDVCSQGRKSRGKVGDTSPYRIWVRTPIRLSPRIMPQLCYNSTINSVLDKMSNNNRSPYVLGKLAWVESLQGLLPVSQLLRLGLHHGL